jgi:diadenosine tetraphosphate (Ap4A) HIT family hydrolase
VIDEERMPDRYDRAVDCIFCRLLKGLLPSWRVYEDERTVAFLDKGQVTRGHAPAL